MRVLRESSVDEMVACFPPTVRWVWAWLTAVELAQVRYIEYSYWNEISGGTRLAADAAKSIRAGVRPYGVGVESRATPNWPICRVA
jgi:hypothetical protein